MEKVAVLSVSGRVFNCDFTQFVWSIAFVKQNGFMGNK